jgi:hypothetical protein
MQLVYPMFAMVVLTFVVLVQLFRTRVRAVSEGRIPVDYFRIYQGAPEPESAAKLSRHFTNLFEAPTLFYVVCLAAMILKTIQPLTLVLAWAYVCSRVAHATIHLGSNALRWRIAAYFTSWIFLFALWVNLVLAALQSTRGH